MRDYTEEELKMLSDVLPNIALQLRTSLSTIYTAVDRLAPQETREKDPKTDRTAAAFYQSYYQLYRVISNLTDAGNLFERKRFELYDDDIVGVCRSVCAEVDFLFAQRGVELDFLADRDSRIIALDAEAIRKLLLNLLSNALKFTPKGGSVRVRVKTEGRFVKITVADTGRGMDSDTLTHLFDRFMDGGQDLIIDLDELLRLFERFSVLRHDEADRVAQIVRQSADGNERILVVLDVADLVFPGNILRRQDGDHARKGLRLGGVDAEDARAGIFAADGGGIAHAVEIPVVGVLAVALHLFGDIDAVHARANLKVFLLFGNFPLA